MHFNLHVSPEQARLSAADLYVVMSEEVMRSKVGVFKDLQIDYDSIQIQGTNGNFVSNVCSI